MSRLATPVPRRPRLRSPAPRTPLSPTHATFEPYAAVFGPGGIVHEPTDTTAEKLAPGPAATRAAAHTPPPSHSGGTSGDLTIPGYQPETPTGTPYDPGEAGHSAQDFAKAFAARRRRELLGALAPLKAPVAPALPSAAIAGQGPDLNLLTAKEQLATSTKYGADLESGALRIGTDAQGRDLVSDPQKLLARIAPLQLKSESAARPKSSTTTVAERSYQLATPKGVVQIPAESVRQAPRDPLGAKTLGNVTLAQLQQAAQKGTLRINKQGTITTPGNRQILHQLLAAHKTLQDSRTLGHANVHGTLTPEEIGTLLVEESNKLHAHLNPAEVAEGIGVAEAESAGNADEQRQLAEFSDPEDAHIGLFAEEGNGFELNPTQRLNAREASRGAIERFVDDERSWNPAWVHWQEIQGENETGADRAPQYRALAKELVQGGKQVDPAAVKQLVDAKHAAVKAGINPTPWNGDVQGGGSDYVWIRGDAKGAVDWAKSTVGTQEGTPRQLHWADLEGLGPSEPWCADWVSVNLARRGVTLPGNPNYSGAEPSGPGYEQWAEEGKHATNLGTDPSVAKPGDLVVYGGGAHIAMYVGDGKVIAGNYGDQVAEYGVDEDSRGISMIIRPKYKGGKVKVKAGNLPGSSSESTFGEGTGGESVGSGTVSEAVPVSAGTQQQGGGQGGAAAALANFTVPTAPGYAATVATPEINGEQSAAQELLALLTQRATGVNRA
jgi:hypothetical protein